MKKINYVRIGLMLSSMILVGSGLLFCAERAVPKTPRELRDALHAVKTVKEAERLIDLKADVRMPRVEASHDFDDKTYYTLLQSVTLNFENDPELINFVVSRGITTEFGEERIVKGREDIYPLLFWFVEGVGMSQLESRPLDKLKNRVKNLMEAGVLISSPVIRKYGIGKEAVYDSEYVNRLLKRLFYDSFCSRSFSIIRYAVTLAQTIHETGQVLSVQRKTLKGELPNILLQFPTPLIDQIIFEYLYPCKIFDKEEIELAKVKALLDDERVQKFLKDEADHKTDDERVIGSVPDLDSHISFF